MYRFKMDLEYIAQVRHEFNTEFNTMLETMRKNVNFRSQGGWRRYRDVQEMFSETKKSLDLAEHAVSKSAASPSKKNTLNVTNRLESFNTSWHNARENALIGILRN